MCCRPSSRSAAAVPMWRRPFGRTSGSPNGCSVTGRRGEEQRSGSRVSMPASSSATRSRMRRAGPRRAPTPRCSPTPQGVLRLNGYKFYSTGTLFADVIAVSALDAEGSTCRRSFRRTGLESNCSTTGTVSVSARPPAAERASPTSRSIPDEVVTVSDGNTLGHATAFLQLYLASVAVGIAYAVHDDAVEYVRTKARPASHSVADSAATDPFVLQAVGEISAAATSAEADRVDGGRRHRPSRRRRQADTTRTRSPTSPSRWPGRSWWPSG